MMQLKEVEYVLNDDCITSMEQYLQRIADPTVYSKDFSIDGEVEDLDCYLQVRNFSFE